MKDLLLFHYWCFRTFSLRRNFPKLKIKSIFQTIDDIIINKKSISRFGDGELRMMIGNGKIVFQNENNDLSNKLNEVLTSNLKNHIVALPEAFVSTKNLKLSSRYFWKGYLNNNSNSFSRYLNKEAIYGNSFISRFYMAYSNKEFAIEVVNKLKQIWNQKDILIVEGEFSRLGVGNDLFKNATSLKRIICPSENAFSIYDKILEVSKKHGKDKLILIALGPTATVLSYDLAKQDFWALDVGHIDVEYMWMLQNAKVKVPIKGRYVSEARDIKDFEIPEEYLDHYNQSIIEKVTF
ncbi:SP_1767 family glycosyltransferase [Flavobacterium sp.]|uniref:SP_1767 family glycosyltransferase n=1 Tax=Flavobacterium sp. TaxID=239 RepID=UPI0037516084